MNDDVMDAAIRDATFDPEARSALTCGEVKELAVAVKTLRRKLLVEVHHSAMKSKIIAQAEEQEIGWYWSGDDGCWMPDMRLPHGDGLLDVVHRLEAERDAWRHEANSLSRFYEGCEAKL